MANVHTPVFQLPATDADAREAVVAAALETSPPALEVESLSTSDPPLSTLSKEALSARRLVVVEPRHTSPIVDVTGDFAEYCRTTHPHWLGRVAAYQRKMMRDYDAEFTLVASPSDLEAELERCFQLEAAGWKGRSGTAILSTEETTRFYGSLARAYHALGQLRVSAIVLDGRLVAFQLGLLYGKRLWPLKGAYDESYRRLAPGLVLLMSQIERCFELDLEAVELLGKTERYKLQFATSRREHVAFRAYRRHPSQISRYGYRRWARPALRRAYRRARSSLGTEDGKGRPPTLVPKPAAGLSRDRVEVIGDGPALGELEGEWRALAELRGNAFITPEWFSAWRTRYGEAADPVMIVARESSGALKGVMPLARGRSAWPRSMWIGGSPLADHLHPTARDPSGDVEVAAAAGRKLGAQITGWSAIVLKNVDAGADWPKAMKSATRASLASVAYRQAQLPYIDLPHSWEAYLATRSRNFRSQLGRKLRSLERDHHVRFRHTIEPRELDRDLATLFRLHDARWELRGGSSLTERARAFHRDFSAAALRRGWLRLWLMEVDGEPVAAWYGWRLGGRYSYYLAGFSPRWSDASVGLLLLAHTVRAAIEEGAVVYDMLLGEEDYKRRFASAVRPVETVVLTRAAHPARLLFRTEAGLWRAYRRLPRGVRDQTRSVRVKMRDRLPSFPGR
jgi:CelD/BcsL family acetyltransferase involved in cellulose biosynthesis